MRFTQRGFAVPVPAMTFGKSGAISGAAREAVRALRREC